jgi:hypothetical protein
MNSLQLHKQVPCKVTAYVDEGMKGLVELLNTFDNISTFESCEGRKGKLAFVYMSYGDESKSYDDGERFIQMSYFVNKLATFVGKYTDGQIAGGYQINISIEWQGDKRFPFISIEMPYYCISEATRLLSLFHGQYKNGRLDKQLSHSIAKDEYVERLP